MKKNTKFQILKNKILSNRCYGINYNQKEKWLTINYENGVFLGCEIRNINLNSFVKEILKDPVLSNLSLLRPLSDTNCCRLVNCICAYLKNMR